MDQTEAATLITIAVLQALGKGGNEVAVRKHAVGTYTAVYKAVVDAESSSGGGMTVAST